MRTEQLPPSNLRNFIDYPPRNRAGKPLQLPPLEFTELHRLPPSKSGRKTAPTTPLEFTEVHRLPPLEIFSELGAFGTSIVVSPKNLSLPYPIIRMTPLAKHVSCSMKITKWKVIPHRRANGRNDTTTEDSATRNFVTTNSYGINWIHVEYCHVWNASEKNVETWRTRLVLTNSYV